MNCVTWEMVPERSRNWRPWQDEVAPHPPWWTSPPTPRMFDPRPQYGDGRSEVIPSVDGKAFQQYETLLDELRFGAGTSNWETWKDWRWEHMMHVVDSSFWTESVLAVSSGEAGSSWSRASGTTSSAEMAGVAKSVAEARPPGIAKHSATTAATAVAKSVGDGESQPSRFGKYSATSVSESELAESSDEVSSSGEEALHWIVKYNLQGSGQKRT